MKQELLEILVRACSREVLKQLHEGGDQRCSTCNGSGEGQADGTKCRVCGGSGSSKKKKLTKNTDPDYDHDLDKVNEGEEADSLSDEDQELHADKEDKERERVRKLNKKKDDQKTGYVKVKGKSFPLKEDETKGAPAPPADGLGTADQPPVPKEKITESLRLIIKQMVDEVLDSK